ncbi:MAG TPA: hypothetical protein VFA20_09680 [Myxococcaceae bacterium]|nr:hypothetical protein [Myxococcaceae bacterium]
MAPAEGEDAWLEQVRCDVLVERLLSRAHAVLEEPRLPVDERLLEEFLRLPAERPLEDDAQATAQLLLLPGGELAVVLAAKHLAEGRQIAQQRPQRIDELHQAPQLGQPVLDRGGRQEEHRRARRQQHLPDPAGGSRLRRVVLVEPELVEPLVDASEDLVRLVDDAEVERLGCEERIAPLLAAGGFAPDQEDAVAVEPARPRLGFVALDVE